MSGRALGTTVVTEDDATTAAAAFPSWEDSPSLAGVFAFAQERSDCCLTGAAVEAVRLAGPSLTEADSAGRLLIWVIVYI